MGKRNRTSFTLVKILSIIYLLFFNISTISMFFIFSNKYYYSIIGVFSFKEIFDLSFYLVFEQSSSFILLIIMLLTIIVLIVTNILIIFRNRVIFFPVLIFSSDIIYQLWLIIKSVHNMYNGWYVSGIIAEIFGITLMISYFFMARRKRNYCNIK